MQRKTTKARRRVRSMMWSLVFIVAAAVALPTISVLVSDAGSQAVAQSGNSNAANPRSNFWREVKGGTTAGTYSAVKGPESTTLINTGGQAWRAQRSGVIQIGQWILLGTLGFIVLFLAIRGRIRIEEPRSGIVVPRWNIGERVLHWVTAIMFILLTITGLSMLFGRTVLIPLVGAKAFAGYATYGIQVHNTLGPFFAACVALMFIFWVKNNIPNQIDFTWFGKGGGLVGRAHPSAGKANGGEKVWFWIVTIVGLGFVSWSGFVLIGWLGDVVPTSRAVMQTYQTVHVWAALIWIAIFFGHAYIGTVGTEGALEGMTKGRVSVEWARQHHDIWYDQVKDKAYRETPGSIETGDARGRESTA